MERLGGWWRLWVLLTLIWGAGVLAALVVNWPNDREKIRLEESDLTLLSPETKNLFLKPLPVPQPGRKGYREVFRTPKDQTKSTTGRSRNASQSNLDLLVNGKFEIEEFWDTSPGYPTNSPVEMRSGQRLWFWFPYGLGAEAQALLIEAAKRDYERVQTKVLWRSRLVHIGTYLAVWISSSLAVLALALGFNWVVRGFKKESPGA